MSELVTLSPEEDKLAGTLDVLAASGLSCRDMTQGFRKSMLTALCIQKLKDALTPEVMKPIMALQGSSLGFRTDKDSANGYPLNVVKDALINAVMVGLLPCGNHFNIISGRMYVTKEGFTYLLDEAKVKYTIDQAVPLMKNGGAIVATDLSWLFDGKEGKKHLEIPVRVNAGMGADAILGKADRKAKCWLYNNLLHAQLSDGDTDSAAPMRNVTPAAQPPAFLGGVEQAPTKGQDALVEPEDESPGLAPQGGDLFGNDEADALPRFGTSYPRD